MTPLDFARNLVASDRPSDVILGIAIVTRGLTDDDGLRRGWPLTPETVRRAASYIGVDVLDDAAIDDVIETCPKVSDAMLNKGGGRWPVKVHPDPSYVYAHVQGGVTIIPYGFDTLDQADAFREKFADDDDRPEDAPELPELPGMGYTDDHESDTWVLIEGIRITYVDGDQPIDGREFL